MELERGIHQMAHGRQPFGLPSPNVYLVQGSRAAMLIDSGYDEDDDHAARMEYIRQAGGPPIMGVLVTHRHRDHAGGAVRLKRDTGAPILAHRDDRDAIERERFQGEAYVDEELQGGETFDLGGLTLEVIHAPGHTMGSVAVLARERHALLSADTILGVSTTLVRPGEGNLRLYVQSVAALRELEPHVIYPGHGGPSSTLSHAWRSSSSTGASARSRSSPSSPSAPAPSSRYETPSTRTSRRPVWQ